MKKIILIADTLKEEKYFNEIFKNIDNKQEFLKAAIKEKYEREKGIQQQTTTTIDEQQIKELVLSVFINDNRIKELVKDQINQVIGEMVIQKLKDGFVPTNQNEEEEKGKEEENDKPDELTDDVKDLIKLATADWAS